MFRIADGEPLGYGDPAVAGTRSSSGSTPRIPAANFMPAPGTLTDWRPPSGPGVRRRRGLPGRHDACRAASTRWSPRSSSPAPTATQALDRSRRALKELVIEGMPTVVPFHRAVLDDPGVHRRRRTFRRTHPLDRDRVRRPHRALRRGRHGEAPEPARAHQDRGRGQRQAARGRGAGRPGRGERVRRRRQRARSRSSGGGGEQRKGPVRAMR